MLLHNDSRYHHSATHNFDGYLNAMLIADDDNDLPMQ